MKRLRVRALGALLGVAVLLGGCATKRDIRTLREQMQAMQDHQDEVLQGLQQQNRLLLDSIRATMSLTQDVRGATAGQLRQFEQNVNQLGNLVTQVMGTLTRIEERLAALEKRPAAVVSGGGSFDEIYAEGISAMGRASYASARAAFEGLIAEFPTHERAPEAQFQLGEIAYLQKSYDTAYQEFEKVPQRWQNSVKAREALMRAAAIAVEQKDNARARRYYERVRDSWPDSDEARIANQKLREIRR